MKKNVAFSHTSFAVLKWDEYLSVPMPFWVTILNTGSVASRARSQLTKFKFVWSRIWTKEVFETKRTTLVYYLQNEPRCGLL